MTKIWNILAKHFQIEKVPVLFLILISSIGLLVGCALSCIIYGILALSLSKLFILCMVGGYGCVFGFLAAIFFEYRQI